MVVVDRLTAQEVAVAALSDVLNAPVSTQAFGLSDAPERFYVVSRIGGGSDDWATLNPRFLLEAYADTELEAERMAEAAWAAWRHLRHPHIHSARPDNNLTRYPATVGYTGGGHTPTHRFQFTGAIQLRRREF